MSASLAVAAVRRRPWSARIRHSLGLLAIAALLGACEGGSGQSGSAFVFLTVEGFSLSGGAIVSSVPSSTSQTTTTSACVTLRNNLKNPTITSPNALDGVVIRSYTVTITSATGARIGGPFTFSTAVLIPAGTVIMGNVGGNTATFSVVLVPPGSKGAAGTAATVEITFEGRDGRGQGVETEGAVSVLFTAGLSTDSSCGSTGGNGNGGTGGNGTGTGGTTP
jgi:hypothetical protein